MARPRWRRSSTTGRLRSSRYRQTLGSSPGQDRPMTHRRSTAWGLLSRSRWTDRRRSPPPPSRCPARRPPGRIRYRRRGWEASPRPGFRPGPDRRRPRCRPRSWHRRRSTPRPRRRCTASSRRRRLPVRRRCGTGPRAAGPVATTGRTATSRLQPGPDRQRPAPGSGARVPAGVGATGPGGPPAARAGSRGETADRPRR